MTSEMPTEPENESTEITEVTEIASDSRGWAAAAHLVVFVSLAILGPLFIWLIKRDEDAFIEQHAREALNFQISITIYSVVSGILMIILIGFVLLPLVLLFALIFTIVAGVKAANGELYEYPLTLRLVKGK